MQHRIWRVVCIFPVRRAQFIAQHFAGRDAFRQRALPGVILGDARDD